jgi:hypothetical protein
MKERFDPPDEPRVPARARFLLASREAMRCCLAERRLVGGTALPEDGRPLGRLDVIAISLVWWCVAVVYSAGSSA